MLILLNLSTYITCAVFLIYVENVLTSYLPSTSALFGANNETENLIEV